MLELWGKNILQYDGPPVHWYERYETNITTEHTHPLSIHWKRVRKTVLPVRLGWVSIAYRTPSCSVTTETSKYEWDMDIIVPYSLRRTYSRPVLQVYIYIYFFYINIWFGCHLNASHCDYLLQTCFEWFSVHNSFCSNDVAARTVTSSTARSFCEVQYGTQRATAKQKPIQGLPCVRRMLHRTTVVQQ